MGCLRISDRSTCPENVFLNNIPEINHFVCDNPSEKPSGYLKKSVYLLTEFCRKRFVNFLENIREGLRAIRANLLRTVLTALIITIGITSLVGILTAIDGIRSSVDKSFSSLGVASFDVQSRDQNNRRNRGGLREKTYPPIKFKEAVKFKETLSYASSISISVDVSQAAEVKYHSLKTNPNTEVKGVDENYLSNVGYNLLKGRNFTPAEVQHGTYTAVIGKEIAEKVFPKEDPLNKGVNILGGKYKVVGVLDKTGSMLSGGGADRLVLIPLINANQILTIQNPEYGINVALRNPAEISAAMSEATAIMRIIRRDPLGAPESFEITKSDALMSSLDNITGYLKAGGFIIGFITLLGASVGLMNIMMVSVTERTREIGVRKSLGATPSRIRQQFLIEAIVICQIGGLAGVILGIVIGNLVSLIIGVGGFIVPWVWVLTGLIICVLVGLISGYYPASKASKLDPIESLRFE